jgi:hypothetical protein
LHGAEDAPVPYLKKIDCTGGEEGLSGLMPAGTWDCRLKKTVDVFGVCGCVI